MSNAQAKSLLIFTENTVQSPAYTRCILEAVHVNWNPYKELLITLHKFKYLYFCSKKGLEYFENIINRFDQKELMKDLPKELSGFWLIPDYWTTIYRSGHVERGRSSENFISFPESTNSYIGYWISSEKNYHEAYGNVFAELADDRGVKFCGIFADVYQNKSVKICGSFRVLSNKLNALPGKTPFEFVPISVAMINPDKAVEYLDWQIARYRTNSSEKWIFGSTNILQRIAYFPNNGEQLKKIDYKENKFKFLDNVQVLQRSATFDQQLHLWHPQRHKYPNMRMMIMTNCRGLALNGTLLSKKLPTQLDKWKAVEF
uniref:HrgA protein n=1 Tax=Globodera pallida TaxID=36090 RepID=A0A183BXQ7_GLOPA